MPSSKHERLYGVTTPRPPKKKKEEAVPDFAVEGGFVNDASGERTKEARDTGHRVP